MEGTKRTILIVDDEPDLHEVLRTRLEKEGFIVHDAFEGVTALRLTQEVNPDVVIIDVMMPGMDGFEVCQRIKTLHPQAKIIVYTAKIEGVNAGRAIAAGADLFSIKTQGLVLLLSSIRRLLGPKGSS
jgi:DNA-binding response OmpR family regulator